MDRLSNRKKKGMMEKYMAKFPGTEDGPSPCFAPQNEVARKFGINLTDRHKRRMSEAESPTSVLNTAFTTPHKKKKVCPNCGSSPEKDVTAATSLGSKKKSPLKNLDEDYERHFKMLSNLLSEVRDIQQDLLAIHKGVEKLCKKL